VGALSAHEAAVALSVSERTIRRAIARGELPAAKQAGVYRIAPADLALYQPRRRIASPPPHRLIPFPTGKRRSRLRSPGRAPS
jgi:excisionase family DNA binding protein